MRIGEGAVEEQASGSASAIQLVDGAVPTRIKLIPVGRIVPVDGREPWLIEDQAHANAVVEATRERLGTLDLMVDYDHQAERAPQSAGRAKAAGWVKPGTLQAEADGIYGEVEWTPAAVAAIEAREYRYLSPWFGHTKDDRRVTRLFNAALTNTPALEMTALAAEQPGDKPMKKIALALGLAAGADEDSIVTAIGTLKSTTSLASIASALSLADSASAEEIATAAAAAAARPESVDLAPIATALGLQGEQNVEQLATAATELKAGMIDATKYVPIETFQALQAKVTENGEEKAVAAVDAAIAAGKIAPANRDFYLGSAKKDLPAFQSFVGNAPVVLKPGETDATAADKTAADQLSEEEKAIASSLGLTEEQFLKTKKDED